MDGGSLPHKPVLIFLRRSDGREAGAQARGGAESACAVPAGRLPADRREEGRSASEFVAPTGYRRTYALWVLRHGPPRGGAQRETSAAGGRRRRGGRRGPAGHGRAEERETRSAVGLTGRSGAAAGAGAPRREVSGRRRGWRRVGEVP